MIQVGKNVTQSKDPLQSVTLERIYKGLINTNAELAQKLILLRQLQTLDANQYRKQKTGLPYLVCGHFQPNLRHKDNFVFTEYFIIDLDHLNQFDLNKSSLKKQLSQIPSVCLLFVSPSNDGLKVVFKLAEKIKDAAYYSLFYKAFAGKLASDYQLEGVVDLKTSDVSRCCFMSFDPEAYYNPNAEGINPNDYLPMDNVNAMHQISLEIKEAEKQAKAAFQANEIFTFQDNTTHTKEIAPDILQDIRLRFNPNAKIKTVKQHYQPEELNAIIHDLKTHIEKHLIQVKAINPIAYGKQIQLQAGLHKSEINLFYGKKGFTVVKTTKTGTNETLTTLAFDIIQQFFD